MGEVQDRRKWGPEGTDTADATKGTAEGKTGV